MVRETEFSHEDFPDDERIKKTNALDEAFKRDFVELMYKHKVTDYVCAVSFSEKRAFMTSCCSDVFLSAHIDMCIVAYNKSIEQDNQQSIN